MPDIKMLFAYTRDRSVVLPHARPGDYHTRLVDLLSGDNNNNCYIISHYQILFKKIKLPKMKGPSLPFWHVKNDENLTFLTLNFFFKN